MPVSRDDQISFGGKRQGDQIVVVRIIGDVLDLTFFSQDGLFMQPHHVLHDLLVGELAPEPGTQKHGFEFVEEPVRNDQLEASSGPGEQQPVWGSLRNGRAEQHPRVEDGAGYCAAFRSRLMACNSS